MSEISLQAVQLGFTPRLVVVIVLLALTWLVAKFSKHMVLRATCGCRASDGIREKMANTLANVAYLSIFAIMLPFILNATGVSSSFIHSIQSFEAQLFTNWPIWMVLSLVVAGIGYVLRSIPKVFVEWRSATRSEI
jgi:hypothetical protein